MSAIVDAINALIEDFSAQGVLDLIKMIVDKIFAFIKNEEGYVEEETTVA